MKQYAKFIAALLAAAGVIASSGLLHGTAELVLNTVIAAVGAAFVYLVPNATAEPDSA
jgi:Na+-transporting NADH:ubiquinone oxidoreductase subunit NqrB